MFSASLYIIMSWYFVVVLHPWLLRILETIDQLHQRREPTSEAQPHPKDYPSSTLRWFPPHHSTVSVCCICNRRETPANDNPLVIMVPFMGNNCVMEQNPLYQPTMHICIIVNVLQLSCKYLIYLVSVSRPADCGHALAEGSRCCDLITKQCYILF